MKHSKLYACLSYLSILINIPALVPGKDSFVRFHLNQGLILLIANILFGCISFIPHMTLAGDLLNCIVLILAVMGIVSAIQGQKKKPAPIWIPAPCLQILRKRPDLCKRRGLIDTSLLHHTRRRKSSFILPL